MRKININRQWMFVPGKYNLINDVFAGQHGTCVNLPHDYMISADVCSDAPAGAAMGYYVGQTGCYTKRIYIPQEWCDEIVYLHFDGVMMNAEIEINGCQVASHAYGYTPFWVNITPYLDFGEENRISITCNPEIQANSRWYTGAGMYRDVELVHVPKVHIAPDGIYAYTKEIHFDEGTASCAFLHAEVRVQNNTDQRRIVNVDISLASEDDEADTITRSAKIQVNPHSIAAARIPVTVHKPRLWDCDHPNLYTLTATVKDLGRFTTRLIMEEEFRKDFESVMFGIRTIQVDSTNGLRINGQSVKLKGGCLHHDHGILGAISLYDSEYRRIKKLKESGFNMVRSAHNPPSSVFLDACDRLGMYVIDEAFDAWTVAKQPGDYSRYFHACWKEDVKAFMYRDRSRACVLFWSTGNEIPERAGLGDGYRLAIETAAFVRELDLSRPVTNGLCSFWSGLDDRCMVEELMLMSQQVQRHPTEQNASDSVDSSFWEERSEPFASMLDVVGYNYMEDRYELAAQMYPERVILGTESYPKNIARIWPMIEKLPYVIGDCTWTAFDYIGEAGIGQSIMAWKDDPILQSAVGMATAFRSDFPWRLANDADFDINGNLTPQGVFRRILWGDTRTGLFVQNPESFGKTELISKWGWRKMEACWNWDAAEGEMVRVVVYSAADTVQLLLNGTQIGEKSAGADNGYTAEFEIPYHWGILEAKSIAEGMVISQAQLVSSGSPAAIKLITEPVRYPLCSDEDRLLYVQIQIVDAMNRPVPNAQVLLHASVDGAMPLAGFGSANPVTCENYTSGTFTSYQGKALAILRTNGTKGNVEMRVWSEGLQDTAIKLEIE